VLLACCRLSLNLLIGLPGYGTVSADDEKVSLVPVDDAPAAQVVGAQLHDDPVIGEGIRM